MKIKTTIFLVITSLLVPTTLLGSDAHLHFSAMFTPEDISSISRILQAKELEESTLHRNIRLESLEKIIDRNEILQRIALDEGSSPINFSWRNVKNENLFGEFIRKVSGNSFNIFDLIKVFRPDEGFEKSEFIGQESIRQDLVYFLFNQTKNHRKGSIEEIESMFSIFAETFANRVSNEDRLFLGITAPHPFDAIGANLSLEGNTIGWNAFKKTMSKKGSYTQVFSSIRRKSLFEPHEIFSRKVFNLSEPVRRGIVDGIDITSSIFEDKQNLENDSSENLTKNLTFLMKFVRSQNIQLRIHIFEVPNFKLKNHLFAKKLIEQIEETDSSLLPVMRIGHISGIDMEIIERFVNLEGKKKSKIIFEVNPYSNEKLQGVSYEKLGEILTNLIDKKFFVLVGSDAPGILGRKSYFTEVLYQLGEDNFLKKKYINQIIENTCQYLFLNRNLYRIHLEKEFNKNRCIERIRYAIKQKKIQNNSY